MDGHGHHLAVSAHEGIQRPSSHGVDAFGLPAEQFAIKNNTHPRETTEKKYRQLSATDPDAGAQLRLGARSRHDRPEILPLDAVDISQLFNSYFDPISRKAMPISHLEQALLGEQLVVAPDNSVVPNPVAEGLEKSAARFASNACGGN